MHRVYNFFKFASFMIKSDAEGNLIYEENKLWQRHGKIGSGGTDL